MLTRQKRAERNISWCNSSSASSGLGLSRRRDETNKSRPYSLSIGDEIWCPDLKRCSTSRVRGWRKGHHYEFNYASGKSSHWKIRTPAVLVAITINLHANNSINKAWKISLRGISFRTLRISFGDFIDFSASHKSSSSPISSSRLLLQAP